MQLCGVQIVSEIEADEDAVEKLGWVRDMYAWSFAAARTGVKHDLQAPPRNPLMVQPPSDTCVSPRVRGMRMAWHALRQLTRHAARSELGDAIILHYTWGPVIYNKSDVIVWEARARVRARCVAVRFDAERRTSHAIRVPATPAV